jgi:hypothetical protein
MNTPPADLIVERSVGAETSSTRVQVTNSSHSLSGRVEHRSRRRTLSWWSVSTGIHLSSTTLTGSSDGALRAGYAGLTDLVWGRLPTFDEAIDIIRDNRHLI